MRASQTSSARVLPSVLAYSAAFLAVALFTAASPQSQGIARSTVPVVSAWPDVVGPGQLEISADGEFVIYQANRGDGWKLYRQRLDESSGTEIPGLGDLPYFGQVSPSGRWLLFGQKGWIWKMLLDGGELKKVFNANNHKMWETDDSIVIGRGASGLSRVPADGSLQREDFAPVDASTGATNYGRPSLLPGGKGALVSVGYGTGNENRHIGIVSFSTGKLTIVPERGAINPRYSESGHILYTVRNALRALPFDLDSLEATGDAATIVDGVHVYSNSASQFDISKNGVLVYIPGPYEVGRVWPSVVVWVDRAGREQVFDTAEHAYRELKLSPNRRFVAAEAGGGQELFVHSNWTAVWTLLQESLPGSGGPVWAPDSSSLFYTRGYSFGRLAIDGSGDWKELLPGDSNNAFWGFSLSADGSSVLGTTFRRGSPEVWQLASVATTGAGGVRSLLEPSTKPRRNPALSQDGQWLAYVEKEGMLDHVYVDSYPVGGSRVLVSGATVDASEPVWGQGLELFYRDGANMVSVRLESAPTLRVVETTPLFPNRDHSRYLNRWAATYDYDVATDRFVMSRSAIPALRGRDIHVIHNAFELLNRLAPRR